MVSVEIRYYNFENVSHQKQLSRASYQKEILCKAAETLFRELWDGRPVRLLGVRTSKLVEEDAPEQISLFDMDFQEEKKKKIQEALEKVRKKYGEDIVKKGV